MGPSGRAAPAINEPGADAGAARSSERGWFVFAAAALIAIGAALRFAALGQESVWGDEIFSLDLASRSLAGILRGAAGEVHPPLYFMLLKLWLAPWGDSLVAARAFSAFASALALIPFAALARRLLGSRAGLGALALMALSPFQLWYAQETRMYALLIFWEAWALAAYAAMIDARLVGGPTPGADRRSAPQLERHCGADLRSAPELNKISEPIPYPSPAWPFWAAIALGLAIRFWMLATGRSPLDGDEGVMGLMARHMAAFEHFPLYFYRQHYMGTIEVPLLAALQWVGPAAWDCSVWPVRLTQAIYLAGSLWITFRLAARFFGARAAHWTVFFLAVAPVFWMDYSQRLRHVVFMIGLGQALALVALRAIDAWDAERRVPARLWAAAGLLIGLAWWHYQLISIFFAGAVVLVAARPWMALSWFLRPADPRRPALPSRRFDPSNAARLFLVVLGCGGWAGMTMGWGGTHWKLFPFVIPALASLALLGIALAWREARREAADGNPTVPVAAADPRWALFAAALGFLVGFVPAALYLFGIREEFWVNPLSPDFHDLAVRTRDVFMMEFASIFEITRSETPGSNIQIVDGRTMVNLVLMGLAALALVRRLLAGRTRREQLGAIYYFAVFGALIALHVVTPRHTNWLEPRFLIPSFLTAAVALGLLAAEFQAAVEASLRGAAARRAAAWGFAAFVVAGSVLLWERGWVDRPGEAIEWPSGHRREVLDIIRDLDAHNVDTIVLDQATNWILLGYEIQYITALRLRCNRGAMGDRFDGLIDETRYHGPEYLLAFPEQVRQFLDAPDDEGLGDEERLAKAGGFHAGHLRAFPVPADYRVRGR